RERERHCSRSNHTEHRCAHDILHQGLGSLTSPDSGAHSPATNAKARIPKPVPGPSLRLPSVRCRYSSPPNGNGDGIVDAVLVSSGANGASVRAGCTSGCGGGSTPSISTSLYRYCPV